MGHYEESEELINTAITILAEQLDIQRDSFFLVVTKEAKEDAPLGDQMVIGEINIKSVVPFISQVISALCEMTGMSPHVFINRYLVGYFVDHDRRNLTGEGYVSEERMNEILDDAIAEDTEGETIFAAYNPHLLDVEN